ncbi:uncharacterized protein LOC142142546 [Mixophyes fleayi]|uniref:uncharacterized protein LOC142142546 n=1 Tax=Mixophyes fleayi TaxID=3061075 RepID=UPI003F4DD472
MVASVNVSLLEQRGYDYNTSHLMNTSSACTYTYPGVINNLRVWSIQVKADAGLCGNFVTINSSMISFTNTLHIDPIAGPLITKNPFAYNFTCAYNLNTWGGLNGLSYYPNNDMSTVIIQTPPYDGHNSYNVTMVAYKDAAYTTPITPDDKVVVGSYVYLALYSPDADGNVFALRAETCFASPTSDRNDPNPVPLVSGGCGVSGDVPTSVMMNGDSLLDIIQINSSLFRGYDAVYIFCDVRLCNISDGCTGCNKNQSGESVIPGLGIHLQFQEAQCYNGSNPGPCSDCGGSCDTVSGCYCRDGFTPCVPAGSECPMGTNDCCSIVSGWYWDPALQCCTEVKQCSPSCMSDEYCNTASGTLTCVCDTTTYMGTTVADLNPTVRCDDGRMTTSISVCQLEQLGYDYNTLHLMNTSSDCSYTYPDVINNVRVWSIQVASVPGYCGNIVTEDSSKIYFTNTLQIDPIAEPLITRNPFIYNFTCAYNFYPVLSTIIIQTPPYNRHNYYTVMMIAYKDAAYTTLITPDDKVVAGSYVYLSLYSPNVDGNVFALRAERCFASPTSDRNDPNPVPLVSGGCGVSGDVPTSMLENGQSLETRIQISSSLFRGNNGVYIFCDVRLCNISDGCTGCDYNQTGESVFPGLGLYLQFQGGQCYRGSDPALCSYCGGSCDTLNGCLCGDSFTPCVPAGSECPMESNDCCSALSNWYWDPYLKCCKYVKPCGPSCRSDEVCDTAIRPTSCVCNTTTYTGTNLKPTVRCDGTMVTSISVCQLEQLGYDYNTLHLINTSSACRFTYPETINNMLVWSIKTIGAVAWCGNIVTDNSSMISFTNTLHIDPIAGSLITQNPFTYNFTCAYNLTTQGSLNGLSYYPNNDMSTIFIQTPPYDGHNYYTVTMAAYKDITYTTPITPDDKVVAGSYVYLALYSPDAEGNVFALRAERCFASPTSDRNDPNPVQLVSGGCGVSGDVPTSVLQNGQSSEARIQISSSLFRGYDAVYIFCDVRLCNISDGCVGCNKNQSGESVIPGLGIHLKFQEAQCYNLELACKQI